MESIRIEIDRDLARTRPFAAMYAALHGMQSLMSEKWVTADVSGYKNSEAVYKKCLEKGVTWQELLNYKVDEKVTL